MPKLKPHRQIILNKRRVNVLLKAYDLTARSFKLFSNGIENISTLVVTNKGKFALRVYQKNKKSIRDIERELAFMEFLRNAKIPIPRVLNGTPR